MAARLNDPHIPETISPTPFAHLPAIDRYLAQGGYDLHVVTTLVRYRLECELCAIGLSADQYAILNLVSNATSIPLDAIPERLHADPLSTLSAIRALRRGGLLKIVEAAKPGHGDVVSLTPAGHDIHKRAGAIAARCNDLLLASLSSEERRIFQLALQQIMRQELSQWLVSAAVSELTPRPTGHLETFGQLTPREVEVYRLLRTGRSNQQISDTLGIQLSTTKTHVTRILEKLGAHSRAEAAAFPPLALEHARWG